jgi:hypothetical protein
MHAQVREVQLVLDAPEPEYRIPRPTPPSRLDGLAFEGSVGRGIRGVDASRHAEDAGELGQLDRDL